jgi:hypothetical protein
MRYNKFTFYEKQLGLTELPPDNYFSQPLTEEEAVLHPHITKFYPEFIDKNKYPVPSALTLPDELQQLLTYSNGGCIVSGEREFGYFPVRDIRLYYFGYGFPKYTPSLLPIAFNGGGVFYACDFRDPANVNWVAVSAGDLDYASAVYR